MIRRPWSKEKRGWALGVSALVLGAAGCGASEDVKRTTPQLTSAQEAALESARYRIDAEGVSKVALIQHMTADGYTRANATFAANNVGADWKAEAVEQAENRLDAEEYSRRSLAEHLGSDGFTPAEVEYAVSKVYD